MSFQRKWLSCYFAGGGKKAMRSQEKKAQEKAATTRALNFVLHPLLWRPISVSFFLLLRSNVKPTKLPLEKNLRLGGGEHNTAMESQTQLAFILGLTQKYKKDHTWLKERKKKKTQQGRLKKTKKRKKELLRTQAGGTSNFVLEAFKEHDHP